MKTSVHLLRQRFGGLLRKEIADTVTDPVGVDDEVRHLLGAIAPCSLPRRPHPRRRVRRPVTSGP